MNSDKVLKKILPLILVVLIYSSFVKELKQIYKADIEYTKAQKQFRMEDFQEALEISNWVLQKNRLEPRYYYGRAKVYLASTIDQDNRIKKELKKLAIKDLETAYRMNPTNLVTLRNMVPMYYFLGIKDLSKPSANADIDMDFIGITRKYFQDIKHYSPNDVGIYVLLAKYEKRLNLTEGYKESIENIKRLRPDLLEWYPSLN